MAREAPGRRRRRIHSDEFKALVVQASQQPGVSLASVALANGLNATMLRRWVVEAERGGALRLPSTALTHSPQAKPAFIQMPLPVPTTEAVTGDIRIEVQRGALRVAVSWPAGAATQCTAWLRELLALIRIDSVWLATAPLDMRAGTDTALARVVKVFGSARPHHAYLFANRRANRLKVLVHDGIGIWLAARRLHQGRFVWPGDGAGEQQSLTHEQLHALVLGLPWQRIGERGVIGLV